MAMKDESLLDLRDEMKQLENKDASYVAGFSKIFNIVVKAYDAAGTPLQQAFIGYLDTELKEIYKVKSEHGKFKHIIK